MKDKERKKVVRTVIYKAGLVVKRLPAYEPHTLSLTFISLFQQRSFSVCD